MGKSFENTEKLKEDIEKASEAAKGLEEKAEYVKLPIGTYLIEREMAASRERQLLNYIKYLTIGFLIVIVLIIGGFLYYLSGLDTSSNSRKIFQDVDSQNGSSYIYDGIHIGVPNKK